jgi:hypothetical protein
MASLGESPQLSFRVMCQQCGAAGPKGETEEEAVERFQLRIGVVQDFVRALREVWELDRLAFLDLMTSRVPCGPELEDDPHVEVGRVSGHSEVGMVGWLNGVVGRLAGGLKLIVVFDEGWSEITGLTLGEMIKTGDGEAVRTLDF